MLSGSGAKFLIDIPGIAVIAYVTEKLLLKQEKTFIYEMAHNDY